MALIRRAYANHILLFFITWVVTIDVSWRTKRQPFFCFISTPTSPPSSLPNQTDSHLKVLLTVHATLATPNPTPSNSATSTTSNTTPAIMNRGANTFHTIR